MNYRLPSILLASVAALCLAQQATKPVIEDKKGRFKVWGLISTGIEFQQGGFRFAASGNPVRIESAEQGLTGSSRTLSGTVSQARGGAMRLRTGTMKGGVELRLAGQDRADTRLESETVQLDGSAGPMRATLPGSFVLTNEATGAEGVRTVVLRAPSGSATFDPPESGSRDPLRQFEVAGPATVRLTNVKGGKLTRDMVVSARRVEYDRGARRMTLSGQVTVEGRTVPEDGPGFEGTMSGLSVVVVYFKEDFTVDRIQAQGAPGTAEVREGGG
jgi:hypothetical protein